MTHRIESRSMRRFVVLVLLVVMQLQLAWGAVAAYCEHETRGAAASHFGHHEHRHATSAAGASQDNPAESGLGKLFGADPDCQSCHFANLGALSGSVATAIPTLDDVPAAVPLTSFVSFFPEGPEHRDRRTRSAA